MHLLITKMGFAGFSLLVVFDGKMLLQGSCQRLHLEGFQRKSCRQLVLDSRQGSRGGSAFTAWRGPE